MGAVVGFLGVDGSVLSPRGLHPAHDSHDGNIVLLSTGRIRSKSRRRDRDLDIGRDHHEASNANRFA